MKFKFKIQQYQTEAVENTVAVFAGQPSHRMFEYRMDLGRRAQQQFALDGELGYRNHPIEIDDATLLKNINAVQNRYDITPSQKLSKGLGRVNLDIEMETGTGKTYVYIKTMFELNKQYGWSKFIIVVPSIAIREGVDKSFKVLEEHFMEHYGKKARWFIYDSKNLHQLDSYSIEQGLSVMIINQQAFAASMREGGRSKESRIIYSTRDEFYSRRPIDVIAANHPIIIMDEPQKLEGRATQDGITRFNPLFVLHYSATHKTKHDTIYALDALDAYRQKLVKRIQVKGFEVKNLRGTSSYLYLEKIVLSPKNPPMARIEIEITTAAGTITRKTKTFGVGDSLRAESGLAQYEGFTISEIHAGGAVTFLNGETICCGEVIGDDSEKTMQRVQIRETILAHLEKERDLYKRGIKCLSLFFIDEVANYLRYEEDGQEVAGRLQQYFEEEYAEIVSRSQDLFEPEYNAFLRKHAAHEVHRGYFAISKKTKRITNGTVNADGESEDISAYDLILKNKERLLSFEEPTRFIFSHSTLREGWDNPNVFQICTLRHADSATAKRQEVGRGLRLCVDKDGTRMDAEQLGEDVHHVNTLTVIANESYSDFTKALQRETREVLRERAVKATFNYFTGKQIKMGDEVHIIDDKEASRIIVYLADNGYIDEDNNITSVYRDAVANGSEAPLPKQLQDIADGVNGLIKAIFDPSQLEEMVEPQPAVSLDNKLNDNFHKAEFQALWKEINHQYVYNVNYDSSELIEKAIFHINKDLSVKQLYYVKIEGMQDANNVDEYGGVRTHKPEQLTELCTSSVRYDLVGEIAKGAKLTRRTVVAILKGITDSKFALFKNNPEEFIRNVVRIIKEQKSTMIVEHIQYDMTEGKYDSGIFAVKSKMDASRAYESPKHVTDYVVWDSKGEHKFAQELDAANDVVVYAKLPRSFKIPTPVGNYAPDWAIALKRDGVKHIFFIAETKGSLSTMVLSEIEKAKIACAKKLFNTFSTADVKYHEVATYQDLLDKMNSLT